MVRGRRQLKRMLRRSLAGGRVDAGVAVVGSSGIEGVGTAVLRAASLSANMIAEMCDGCLLDGRNEEAALGGELNSPQLSIG